MSKPGYEEVKNILEELVRMLQKSQNEQTQFLQLNRKILILEDERKKRANALCRKLTACESKLQQIEQILTAHPELREEKFPEKLEKAVIQFDETFDNFRQQLKDYQGSKKG